LLTELPVLPGLHIDAEYVAGRRSSAARAWFDVVALTDGRAAMLVGDAADIAERGVPAAAMAAHVRAALVRMQIDDRNANGVLRRLSLAINAGCPAGATTASVAVIDPIDGEIQYSHCGPRPPVPVLTPDNTRHLRSPADGIDGADRPVVGRDRLGPDEVLVLCSNGSGEQLPRLEDVQQVRTEAVCRSAADHMRRASPGHEIAFLAVQRRRHVPRFEMTVPAVADSLDSVGDAIGDWLGELRSSVEDGAGMALAIGEAMLNAVTHAFVGDRAGSVMVEATLLADGVVVCFVRDNGRWLPPRSAGPNRRGGGFGLMARVCDRFLIHREPGGTVVELRRRLHHPVIGHGTVTTLPS